MNAKISVFVISVEATIYLLLYNLDDCTFKDTLKVFSDFKNKQQVYEVMIFDM